MQNKKNQKIVRESRHKTTHENFLLIALSVIILVVIFGYLYKQNNPRLITGETNSILKNTVNNIIENRAENTARNIVVNYLKTNNITSETPIVKSSTPADMSYESPYVYFKSASQPQEGISFDYYLAELNVETATVKNFEKKSTCILKKVLTEDQAFAIFNSEYNRNFKKSEVYIFVGYHDFDKSYKNCYWFIYNDAANVLSTVSGSGKTQDFGLRDY